MLYMYMIRHDKAQLHSSLTTKHQTSTVNIQSILCAWHRQTTHAKSGSSCRPYAGIGNDEYVYMLMCMYVCRYVCMYVCMYACVFVCMNVCMYACMFVCRYVCLYVRMCMYV